MRCIAKQTEPAAFSNWKKEANEQWQPSYGALQNPEKRVLHEALLNEQGNLCCYCGRRVSLLDSHIEHFRPQESWQTLALTYENLHASCIREVATCSPLHCGHAKGGEFKEEFAISPLDEHCESRFIYSSQDGSIYATDVEDASAKFMVKLLRLDISFLRARRAEALKNVFDTSFVGSATNEELVSLAKAFRAPGTNGEMTEFGHVLARFAEQLLEKSS